MKLSLVLRLYALILLIIFGGIVLHAPASVFLGSYLPEFELLIKSWKEVLIVIAAAIAVFLVWRHTLLKEFIKDRIIQIAGLYGALHLLTASALLAGPLATVAGLMIDLRYIVYFVLVYICLKLAPGYKKRFLQVGAAGAVIVIGFGVLQFFLPADILTHIGYGEDTIQPYLTVDENPDYIRINSTMRGPNPLGAYSVIVLALLFAFVVKQKRFIVRSKRTFLSSLLGLGGFFVLWLTYSRSAAGAAGAALLIVAAVSLRHVMSRKLWIIGCALMTALVGGITLSRESSFVEHVLLHENDEGGSPVSSNDDHVSSLMDGSSRMLRQPIGAGIGSTGSASLFAEEPLIIENQYLFIAHEVGWLGLLLFTTLLMFVLKKLWDKKDDWLALGVFASGTGLSLIGLLLPVWVDDTVSILWWGLAAVAISTGGKNARRTTKQKTT